MLLPVRPRPSSKTVPFDSSLKSPALGRRPHFNQIPLFKNRGVYFIASFEVRLQWLPEVGLRSNAKFPKPPEASQTFKVPFLRLCSIFFLFFSESNLNR